MKLETAFHLMRTICVTCNIHNVYLNYIWKCLCGKSVTIKCVPNMWGYGLRQNRLNSSIWYVHFLSFVNEFARHIRKFHMAGACIAYFIHTSQSKFMSLFIGCYVVCIFNWFSRAKINWTFENTPTAKRPHWSFLCISRERIHWNGVTHNKMVTNQ